MPVTTVLAQWGLVRLRERMQWAGVQNPSRPTTQSVISDEEIVAPDGSRSEVMLQSRSLELRSGYLYRRSEWPDFLVGPNALRQPLYIPSASEQSEALMQLHLRSSRCAAGAGTAVYIDGETTGLHGSSNRFCVVGIAYAGNSGFICEQWILSKLSAESKFLTAIVDRLDELNPQQLVSFNGASFDLPLFRRRLAAHRSCERLMQWRGLEATGERSFIDLVHAARRVWRGRVPDCKLQTLERCFLGIDRVDDLPGAMVPSVYWEWLRHRGRAREEERMDEVLLHNRIDLVVMPRLAVVLANRLSKPRCGEDALRAMCHFEKNPGGPEFLRAAQTWQAAGFPYLQDQREERCRMWLRGLESQSAEFMGMKAVVCELLRRMIQIWPRSSWVKRRAVKWGIAEYVFAEPPIETGYVEQPSLFDAASQH